MFDDGDARRGRARRGVWEAAYADARAWPAWNPELAAATLDGPLRFSPRARIRFKTGLRLRFTVTEFEPGRVFSAGGRATGRRGAA